MGEVDRMGVGVDHEHRRLDLGQLLDPIESAAGVKTREIDTKHHCSATTSKHGGSMPGRKLLTFRVSALMDSPPRIVIIGAGPCGLGCARELDRLGHHNWVLCERSSHAGGHAASHVDPHGFTWDEGGHVVFSHYREFDRLLEEAMGDEVFFHERSSYIRFDDRWVPYPFQNNLRHLPPEPAFECLVGLIEAPGGDPSSDFGTWMERTFGTGITKHFMRPYNFKVWATPPEQMQSQWIGERVSVVDYKGALKTVIFGEDDAAWGPNNTFMFPTEGGTGENTRRVAQKLGGQVTYDRQLAEVDADAHTVTFRDGTQESYDYLVSTMPLDLLVKSIVRPPDPVRAAAEDLEHNGVYIVGVGYETPLKDDKSWLYFPQDNTPFTGQPTLPSTPPPTCRTRTRLGTVRT